MADISILEFIVYAIICYTGMIMLIISAFKETPSTKNQSAIRVIWLIPSIFTAYMLASAGVNIFLESSTETVLSEYEVLDSSDVVTTLNSTTTTTTTEQITLLQPVWTTLHVLFFFVMLIYVIINMLMLFTRRD